MNLETDLRQALKRKHPASGFHDRVMARLPAAETVRVAAPTRWRRGAALPIAASLLLAFGAAYYVQKEQHQRRVDETHAQTAHNVVLALRIASETVSAAQAKVQEITWYESTNNH